MYQTALNGGGFPVEVRGAAYTEAQLKSQVSMLLAQAAGGEASLAKLKKVQQAAESEVETLAVRIGSTETQLAVLSTERELLRARLITNEGEELMAQMDELMTGNSQLIAGNPVRTVQDLMKVPASRSTEVASGSSVDDFLAGTSTVEPVSFETEKPGSRRSVIIEELPAGAPPVRQHKPTRPGKIKPIFQQS